MTLEQEIKLAAKHAAQEAAEKASKEAYEKGYKEAEKGKELAVRNNARKLKESGVSVEIISECTGLSLQEIQEL